MVDFKKYHERIERKIGEAMAADKILEGPWWDVVIKDLNLMSYYCAHDIGVESAYKLGIASNAMVDKGTYKLSYEDWPPGRLFALNLILSYWLGWISRTHGPWEGLDLIQQTYVAGLNEFLQGDEGKQWLKGPKGEQWLQSDKGKEWQQQQDAASKSAGTENSTHRRNSRTI